MPVVVDEVLGRYLKRRVGSGEGSTSYILQSSGCEPEPDEKHRINVQSTIRAFPLPTLIFSYWAAESMKNRWRTSLVKKTARLPVHKMPEEEDEKPGNKGVSVKSGFFGRISYVYEYDGNKTDAPRCWPAGCFERFPVGGPVLG
jgi:hypothetical protein